MIVWPGLRRSVSAIQRLFNSASFYAPLTHSAIPVRAAAGTTGTFTRATPATVRDHEGVLRTVPSGCARFEGARYVRNLIAGMSPAMSSEDVRTMEQVDSGGSTPSADQITFTASNAARALTDPNYVPPGYSSVAGRTFMWAATVWVDSGTKDIRLDIVENGVGHNYTAVTVTTTPTRVSMTKTFSGSAIGVQCGFQNDAAGTAGTIRVTNMQLEDITGRTDQTTPSEYVSVGVESAPYYHGSFVDGVKCFATDLAGNALTTMRRYNAEGARTNLCLQSDDMANAAWTSRSAGNPTRTNNLTAADGTPNKWASVTNLGTAGVGDIYATTALTLVADTRYEPSFYAKQITPSGTIVFRNAYGDAFGKWTINLALLSASVFERITRSHAAVTVNNEFIGQTGTGFYQVQWFASSGSVDVGLGGAQVELGSFASSYIATTTAAVTRNADVLTYSSAGNIDGTKGWCYAEVIDTPNTASIRQPIIATYPSGNGLIFNTFTNTNPASVEFYDGTAFRTGQTYTQIADTRKFAASWGTGCRTAVDGSVTAQLTFDGDAAVGTLFSVGNYTDGSNAGFRNIGPIYIGQRQLSASEMQAITR